MKQVHGAIRGVPWPAMVIAGIAFAGCGRNQGALPAGFAPDGVLDNSSFLITQVDSVLSREGIPTAAVIVTVLDKSGAEGFVLYRKADGDLSFQKVNTFAAPFQETFSKGFAAFQALDYDLVSNRGAEYRARAVVNGAESKASPLTPSSYLPAGNISDLLPKSFHMLAPIDTANTDSLPTMQWEAVPGAVRYFLQLVRADGKLFAAIVTPADGSTSYKMQSGLGVVVQEAILTRSTFFWNVVAINASGFLIGQTPGFQIFIVNPPPPPPF